MSSRIKVLYIASTLESGGITQVLLNTCKYIDYSRFKVYILTLSPEPANTQIDKFKKIPVHLDSLNLSRFESLFFLKKQLQMKVNEINPDIIHTSTFRPSHYAAKYLSSYKRMVSLASNLHPNYIKSYGNLLGKYIANQELNAFKKADIKTVVSHTLASIYSTIPGIHVIQNGVDEQVFFPADIYLKRKLRLQLGIDLDAKVYLSIGALTPLKDPKTLLHAFMQKRTIEKDICLVLGTGPEMNELQELVKNFPQIKLLGFQHNPQEYLMAADVFVSCSHSEGLPNTVLEAAACGLTCILSDIPQHREIFEKDSTQALFFACSNVFELTYLLEQDHLNLAMSKFQLTAKSMTAAYMEYYQK